jgi:CRISPR-associated endonuclease/helicase Cas3
LNRLSKELAAAVAKSDRESGNDWLPFWMHSFDTAGIMEKLAQKRLPESISDYLCAECGGREKLFSTLKFCALVHDIGKLTIVFQSRIYDAVDFSPFADCVELPKSGSLVNASNTPHALASEAILLKLGCPKGVASIAGAHHGRPSALADVCDQINGACTAVENFYGKRGKYRQLFESLWKEWNDFSLECAGFSELSDLPDMAVPAQVVISGMLVTADWIASNTTYFPLISADQKGEFGDYPKRIENAWTTIGFPNMWESKARFGLDDEAFKERFGFLPNPTQADIISTATDAESSGIYIIEAPMGLGKTEAALALSEILAARAGAGGMFFGMPTQATSNGIFPRLEKWAGGLAEDEQTLLAIKLAHGNAALNEDYRELFTGHSNLNIESDSGLIVHDWFSGRKQTLLSDFVIGTVDQLLMAALKQKHVMLKHFGLSGKVVVVDECHAYDAYMSQYLDMAIKWLGIYKVPVIILSATLPEKRRAELIEAYTDSEKRRAKHTEAHVDKTIADEAWKHSLAYPLLTYTENNAVKQKALAFDGENKEVSVRRIIRDEVAATAGYAVERGGCVGVIVNTVRKAQEIAAELQSAFPKAEVIIMHAQFIMTDRAKREEQILKRVGKHSTPESRRRLIIVGTQVLEQSLDLDFDLMITELCPMDLLLQRTGRLHRHNRVRPQGLETASCFVLDETDDSFDSGSAAIYGEWLLMRTRALLPNKLTIPSDIPLLVQQTYDETNNEMLGELTEGMKKAQEENKLRTGKKRSSAENYLISKPSNKKGKGLDGWLDNDIKPNNEQTGEKAVRDGDPSVDVIALMRDREGLIRIIADKSETIIPADRPPSREEALLIARQKLRLPGFFGRRWKIDDTIEQLETETQNVFSAWQDSALLKEEVVLLFDEDLNADLAGVQLHYDIKTGLTYVKE